MQRFFLFRRLLRFRIRHLLLGMLVLSVVFAYVNEASRAAVREQRALSQLPGVYVSREVAMPAVSPPPAAASIWLNTANFNNVFSAAQMQAGSGGNAATAPVLPVFL